MSLAERVSGELGEDLRWAADVVWGPDAGAVLSRARGGGHGARGETFAVMPKPERPRLLVPLTSRRLAASVLRSFGAGMSPGWLWTSVASACCPTGCSSRRPWTRMTARA
jgi:hypothetical protein